LLVAFAGLALVSRRIVNNRQASELLTLQTELATAKKNKPRPKDRYSNSIDLSESRAIDEARANEALD
jgi:hypothetical protein